MTKKITIGLVGIAALSLLLAGCAGLLPKEVRNPASQAAVPLLPADPSTVLTLDPKVIGEGMIEPAEEYEKD